MRTHKLRWLMPATHTCMMVFSKAETYFLMFLFEARSHVFSLSCGNSLLGCTLETEEANGQFLPFGPVLLSVGPCVLVMCCCMWLAQQGLEPLCNTEAPGSLCWLSSAVWISLELPPRCCSQMLATATAFWRIKWADYQNNAGTRYRLLPEAQLDCFQLFSMQC